MTKLSWIGLAALFALLALCCSCLWGRPTTAEEAEKLVVGWLKADPKPLGMSLGQQVREVETSRNESGEAIYYIVYLQPYGFVIVSADDLVEPIIGFVQGDSFDPSPENPLGALVTNDLKRRIAAVRTGSGLRIMAEEPFHAETRAKWRHFIDLASARKDGVTMMASGITSISDVRVAPLVQSKWDQRIVSDDCPLACYNYYTPNNYLCGCPATALAQLMRYFEYPTTGIGVHQFTITVNGGQQTAYTRGGDGSGGPYNWSDMVLDPKSICETLTEKQRQAIGALCYDAGVSMNTSYSSSGSGWPGGTLARMINALRTTFTYANAVHGYNSESPIGGGLIGMINPNLDAKKPVVLSTIQHAFVCDGYGYNYSTLYHHLNMGWLGQDDAWYDLNTSIGTSGGDMGIVCSCVYNVQTLRAGEGEIVSGRVLNHSGRPMVGVVLYLKAEGEIIGETETDSKGIYAFDYLESNTAYTVNAVSRGYGFNSQEVTTGISRDNSVVSGNVWAVDFMGLFCCGFNGDGIVDFKDFCRLAQYWGQYETSVDIAPPPFGDGIVDFQDLAVFAEYWLSEILDPDLLAHWKLDETEGTIAHDLAGGNNGTLHGGPLWQPTSGKVDGALQLDGTNDYVSTPFILNPSAGAFSAFFWAKGGAPGQVLISQQNGLTTWLGSDSSYGKLITSLKDSNPFRPALVSDFVITDGDWHQVGVVWDGARRHLYADGEEVAADSSNLGKLVSYNGGLYIGAGPSLSGTSFWSGLIDDVRIYNRAVTP